MLSLPRRLLTLFALLIVIGLFRGWFTFSSPHRDQENHKVNINVSVDTDRLEADAEKLKQAGEKVAQRIKERRNQAPSTAAEAGGVSR